jgi:hypothetical protein
MQRPARGPSVAGMEMAGLLWELSLAMGLVTVTVAAAAPTMTPDRGVAAVVVSARWRSRRSGERWGCGLARRRLLRQGKKGAETTPSSPVSLLSTLYLFPSRFRYKISETTPTMIFGQHTDLPFKCILAHALVSPLSLLQITPVLKHFFCRVC